MQFRWDIAIVQNLFQLKWILVGLPFIYLVQSESFIKHEFRAMLFFTVAGWLLLSKMENWFNFPPDTEGMRIRFKQCLKLYNMEEARNLALKVDEPYRSRMLRLAWRRFSQKADTIGYRRNVFLWLDGLTDEQRKTVAPGSYKKCGRKLVERSIDYLMESKTYRTHVDWEIAEKIDYEFSHRQLRKAAKFGEPQAIDLLKQGRSKGRVFFRHPKRPPHPP